MEEVKALVKSMTESEKQAWRTDQVAKSTYFHQKLHEWKLLEIARIINEVRGEDLNWNCQVLEISEDAWNKVIHRGIKPVIVFAHPEVLTSVKYSTMYYRLLAMVSQKSMMRIGLNTKSYERGRLPSIDLSLKIAKRLNKIISLLIESDKIVDLEELVIWRGLAAGSQAQGSWGTQKGKIVEEIICGLIKQRIVNQELISGDAELTLNQFKLNDGRVVKFSSEPDVAVYRNGIVESAVEIKGGVDRAGVLERVGAAIKSLGRAKEENPNSITILILQAVSLTQTAMDDIERHKNDINHLLTIEGVVEEDEDRDRLFELLRI